MLAASYASLLRQLTSPADVYHRDGWLFQMISWVAAKSSDPELLSRAPQPRSADKGFDGLLVEPAAGKNGTFHVILCEDKATTQSRNVIREDVWPSIRQLETGKRDPEILSELTTVLAASMSSQNAQSVVKDIAWKNARRYRVSVTVTPSRTQDSKRRALFKGYRRVAPGKCARRRGEMFPVDRLAVAVRGARAGVSRRERSTEPTQVLRLTNRAEPGVGAV
jgi:hypothetical protein